MPRLLFDVTRLRQSGLHTGIQRVVRNLIAGCEQISGDEPDRQAVVPVYADGAQWHALSHLEPHPLQGRLPGPAPTTTLLTPRADDTLLLFDASWYVAHWDAVDRALDHGAALVGMVHDLLPLRRAGWFRPELQASFRRHLDKLIERAHHVFVPSTVVAAQLAQELDRAGRQTPLSVLAHGGDFLLHPAHTSGPQLASIDATAALPADVPLHIVVSTLEPRKQHALVLDAFDRLWQGGHDATLALVGGVGWQVDELVTRIRQHRMLGRRLFHLGALTDPELDRLYRRASSLIYMSRDEGFGLPVLEAAMAGCPVIAADIPVLRETGQRWPVYLPVDDVSALACAVQGASTRLLHERDRGGGFRPSRRWCEVAADMQRILTSQLLKVGGQPILTS